MCRSMPMVDVRICHVRTDRRGGCRILSGLDSVAPDNALQGGTHASFSVQVRLAHWPTGQLVLSIALSLSMSVGLTHAGQWETLADGTRCASRAFRGELIELNSVFAEDNSCVVTPCRCNSNEAAEVSAATATELPEVTRGETALRRRTDSGIRLVALEMLSESSSAGSNASAEIPPTFVVPQQTVFHEAASGAITGPSTTQGTWVVFAPYGWISGINGQIATPGRVLNINVSPSDVLQHLGDVNGAFRLHTEFGRGDWTSLSMAV